jgi:cytochrome oxidase Cu insertion factor (SCO1/SenC/PrrC family)
VTALRRVFRSPAPCRPAPQLALGKPARAIAARARHYFASDSRRTYQTALGLVWLLDGALQFQGFMYTNGFIQALKGTAAGQPHWVVNSIDWAANIAHSNLTAFDTLFALIQVAIGLGLLYRKTVKPALALSIVWALGVWWFGEGFGMIFAGTADPLTGAPGAVLLYALIAVLVWPSARPAGLLSVRVARGTWGALWLGMSYLWLLPANSSGGATFNAIMMAPAGMSVPGGQLWLTRLDTRAELAALGHGALIALVLAGLSAAIAIAVWRNWRPLPFLAAAIVLNLGYWVLGQNFGGMFFTNSATDPNAGPLFVLLALVMYSLTPIGQRAGAHATPRPGRLVTVVAAAVGLAAAGSAVWVSAAWGATSTPSNSQPQPVAYGSPFDGVPLSLPVTAPPVALHNAKGQQITLGQYEARGDTVLMTILSADCSGTCTQVPTQLQQSLAAMPLSERSRVDVIARSTGPKGDTRASTTAFLGRYGLTGRMRYLAGSAAQLRPVWREWGLPVASTATDVTDADAVVYGIVATGAVMNRYSAFFTPKQILHDVKQLQAL